MEESSFVMWNKRDCMNLIESYEAADPQASIAAFSAILDDLDYQRFLEITKGLIWSGCWGFSVISLCVDVYNDKACVALRVAGFDVAKTCSDWQRNGNILRASIGLGTVNTGQWKLQDPRITFEYNTASNRGSVRFSTTLYEWNWRRFKYDERKKWDNEVILSW